MTRLRDRSPLFRGRPLWPSPHLGALRGVLFFFGYHSICPRDVLIFGGTFSTAGAPVPNGPGIFVQHQNVDGKMDQVKIGSSYVILDF